MPISRRLSLRSRAAVVAVLALVVASCALLVVGAFVAGVDLSRGDFELLLAVALACVLLGTLAAWLLADRLRRPIRALIGNLERLGAGDYTRPDAVAAPGEIVELADAVDRMREKLR